MKQEQERGITIQSAAISFSWSHHMINLIDTPGHADFNVEVERAIRVLDGTVVILDAVSGVEAQCEQVWSQANRHKIQRIVFINKMDRDGANIDRCIQDLKLLPYFHHLHTPKFLQCQFPVFVDNVFCAIVDVITSRLLRWPDSDKKKMTDSSLISDTQQLQRATFLRQILVEELAEVDDVFLDILLSTENHMDIPSIEIKHALRRACIDSQIIPIFCGAAQKNIGIQPLLDAIVAYLPSPLERPPVYGALETSRADFSPALPKSHSQKAVEDGISASAHYVEIKPDRQAPLTALAFKVIFNKQRGFMVFVRIYSGL